MPDKKHIAITCRKPVVRTKFINSETRKKFEEIYTRVDKHASSTFFKILILHNYPEVHIVLEWSRDLYPDPNNNVEEAGKMISNGMFSVDCLVRTIKAHDLIPVNGRRRVVQLITKRPNVPFKVDEIRTRCSENRSPYVERAVIIMAYYLLPGVVDNLEMCYQLKNALTDDEHMSNKGKQRDSVMAKIEFDYYKHVEDAHIRSFQKYLMDLKIDWEIWACCFALAKEVILYDDEVMELYDGFVIDISGRLVCERQRSCSGKHTLRDLYDICCKYTREREADPQEMDMFKYLLMMLIGDYDKKAMWNGLLLPKYVNLFQRMEELRIHMDENRFEKKDQKKEKKK